MRKESNNIGKILRVNKDKRLDEEIKAGVTDISDDITRPLTEYSLREAKSFCQVEEIFRDYKYCKEDILGCKRIENGFFEILSEIKHKMTVAEFHEKYGKKGLMYINDGKKTYLIRHIRGNELRKIETLSKPWVILKSDGEYRRNEKQKVEVIKDKFTYAKLDASIYILKNYGYILPRPIRVRL